MPELTIASPNTTRTLLTTEELRAAAGVSDGSKDAQLALLNGYVSAMITKACKVATSGAIPPTLRRETVAETFHLKSCQSYLALARKLAVDVSSVVVDDGAIDATEYDADGDLLYSISANSRIPWSGSLIVVTYAAGFSIVPDDLRYAAIKFVQAELLNAGRDPMLRSKSIEGVSSYEWWVDPTKDTHVPPDVMSILEDGGYVKRWGWMS